MDEQPKVAILAENALEISSANVAAFPDPGKHF